MLLALNVRRPNVVVVELKDLLQILENRLLPWLLRIYGLECLFSDHLLQEFKLLSLFLLPYLPHLEEVVVDFALELVEPLLLIQLHSLDVPNVPSSELFQIALDWNRGDLLLRSHSRTERKREVGRLQLLLRRWRRTLLSLLFVIMMCVVLILRLDRLDRPVERLLVRSDRISDFK